MELAYDLCNLLGSPTSGARRLVGDSVLRPLWVSLPVNATKAVIKRNCTHDEAVYSVATLTFGGLVARPQGRTCTKRAYNRYDLNGWVYDGVINAQALREWPELQEVAVACERMTVQYSTVQSTVIGDQTSALASETMTMTS